MAELSEKHIEANRILIAVFYEGPWERVMNWLWYLGPGTASEDAAIEHDRTAPDPSPAAEEKLVDLMAALETSINEAKAARDRHPQPAAPVPAGGADTDG